MSSRACIEQGCGKKPYSIGLCRDHFDEVRPEVWPRCAATDYIGVHHELRRYLGPARSYPCADCQKPAEDWSYQGGAPDERLGSSGPFSRDPSFYAPRCRSCHRRHDAAARTHCRKGHPYEEDNTYTTPAGERRCRACMRRRHVARYRAAVGYEALTATATGDTP